MKRFSFFSLILGAAFILLACEKKPPAIFEPSENMHWILMVSHSMHSFTPCQPLANQEVVIDQMDEVRGKKEAEGIRIFEETNDYVKMGPSEGSARHYFASKAACENFTLNLTDMGFKSK